MRTLLIIIPLIFLSLLFTGGLSFIGVVEEEPEPSPTTTYKVVGDATHSADKSLQLRTISLEPNSPGCDPGKKVAVDLLLDTSGSMTQSQRIVRLTEAVNSFVQSLQDDDAVGIQTFSSSVSDKMQIAEYRTNKSLFPISLSASGTTSMNDGFLRAKSNIDAARSSFPNHTWVLIFLSDGIPTDPDSGVGPYEPQNPTSTAQQIKNSNVRIISIGLELGSLPPEHISYGRGLLNTIASDPKDQNFYDSPSADQLQSIYQSIGQSLCR